MSHQALKNLLMRLLKLLVFFTAGWFIYQVVIRNYAALSSFQISNPFGLIMPVSVSVLVYTMLMMSLVMAWLALLDFNHPQACARYYLKSQALKYIPGNIFHFTYRHSKTKKLGFSHKKLISIGLAETVGLVMVAILVANFLFFWPDHVSSIHAWLPQPTWLILLPQLLLMFLLFRIDKGPNIWMVFGCYLSYFFGMGLVVLILCNALAFSSTPWLFLTGCYAISWLGGYVIPGAPGGMGVREAIFILVATPKVSEPEALILIAAIRLIAVAAEILMYAAANPLSQVYAGLSAWSGKTKQ